MSLNLELASKLGVMGKGKFNSQWFEDEQFLRLLASTNDTNEANNTFKLGTMGINATESHSW